MFSSARFKLTAWYLLIIMFVSILFSVIIYRGADRELERISRRQHTWSDRFRNELNRPERADLLEPIPIDEIRERIILSLVFINGIILVIAGGAGYFLAGKTLQPIKEMVDEQNRFIADASHELRTPLTVIKSSLEVNLRDKKLTLDGAKKLITDNIEEVNKMQTLSDHLLQLAQYQKPQSHTRFEKLSLKILVEQAIVKTKTLTKHKNISIESELADVEIEGDKYGLADLLIILLDNAVKYSHEKQKIKVSAQKSDGSAILKIIDYGIGIDEKDVIHIFDRFYRSNTARVKSTKGGFGLGLAIAKQIVENHHGSISVISKLNSRTTFTVQLPIIMINS